MVITATVGGVSILRHTATEVNKEFRNLADHVLNEEQ